jgi:phosphatidylglycerophosphate synthase
MPASPLGKIKMAAQVVAILALILGDAYLPGMFLVGRIALWVVVIAALVSGFEYFRRFNGVASARVADIPVARNQRTERKAG